MKAIFATPVDGARDEFGPAGTMRVMSFMCNDISDFNLRHGGCTMTRSDDHLPELRNYVPCFLLFLQLHTVTVQ